MKVQEEWYKEARNISLEQLPEFLERILTEYSHDYGTIVHAMTAGAIATAWAMNKHPQGGITGFQAGCLMWGFIRHWNYEHNKTGMSIQDYDNMLYPQYEDKFQKTISQDVWGLLKKQAQTELDEADEKHDKYLMNKEQYETDIGIFVEKFPDYYENRKKYDRLGGGTVDEWEEEKKKEKEKFEFAPSEPYETVWKNSRVYQHWISIVKGKVPFGYTAVKD